MVEGGEGGQLVHLFDIIHNWGLTFTRLLRFSIVFRNRVVHQFEEIFLEVIGSLFTLFCVEVNIGLQPGRSVLEA